MRIRSIALAGVAAATFAAMPAWADRGHGPVPGHGVPPAAYGHGGYGGHGDHGGHFWGPLGFVLGTAILYSALEPRTVYYEPQVVYTPPVYYYPPTTYVQPYLMPGDPVISPVYIVPPSINPPPSPSVSLGQNIRSGPGVSGEQWWYVCRKPAGYYPNVRECSSGWEKVPPVPADAPR